VGARARRRGRPGRRAIGRWFRRQDRLTKGLLLGVGALAGFLVLLALLTSSGPRTPAGKPIEPTGGNQVAAPQPGPRPLPRHAAREARKDDDLVHVPAARPAPPPAAAGAPRAAIVIDDLGQTIVPLHQLAALGFPISIAVLPRLEATAATVREAARLKIETLLHLPLEPREEGGKHPGPGALFTSMSREELETRLREDLASVPGAVGVNNHMGSRFTADARAMAALLAALRGRGLFWLDSRTTPDTVGAAEARAQGVPTAERDVFIDAEVRPEFIREQLRKLVALARSRGSAIGIGHPHPETLAALEQMRTELLASGVTWVPASALVTPPAAIAAARLHAGAP
jgi:polysaccharide deacetylase 2 family uncharacterized protein YibQ